MPVSNTKLKYFIYIIAVVLIISVPVWIFNAGSLMQAVSAARFTFMDKAGLNLSLESVDTGITTLSADPSDTFVLRVTVRDSSGTPIPGASFRTEASGMQERQDPAVGYGSFSPSDGRTGGDGTCLISYSPPALTTDDFKNGDFPMKLTVSISGTDTDHGDNTGDNSSGNQNKNVSANDDSKRTASIGLKLVRIPVVFVHGYKATPDIFNNLKEYLDTEGFSTNAFSYNSDNGVAAAGGDLQKYLDTLKKKYYGKGIQVGKFDIIGHSMGGLVARYYTCSADYARRDNVDKLIFLSVPHNGSPLASLGLKYYSDKGIYDLIPDSSLYTDIFPSMINQGLNSTIQTGNILGQYDEVVSPESASLEAWNIKTELFNVGESNFTMDKLLSGEIVEASNHKNILFNTKVFQRVSEMLGSPLPYPIRK